MFGFNILVHGLHGDGLPQDENLTDEELEVYGVDWAALRDVTIYSFLTLLPPRASIVTLFVITAQTAHGRTTLRTGYGYLVRLLVILSYLHHFALPCTAFMTQ